MKPRERFLTAVQGGVPDVVPVAPLIHSRFAHKLLTAYDWRAVYQVHRLIGSVHFRGPLGVGYRVDWDGGWESREDIKLGTGGRVIRHHTLSTPHGDLGSTYVYHVIPDDPLVGKWVEYPVKEPADWDVYQAYLEELTARSVEPALETVQEAHRVMGDEGVASVGVGSAFGRLGNARGLRANIAARQRDAKAPSLAPETVSPMEPVGDIADDDDE